MDTAKLIVLLLAGFAVVTVLAAALAPGAALYVVPFAATVVICGLGCLRKGRVRS